MDHEIGQRYRGSSVVCLLCFLLLNVYFYTEYTKKPVQVLNWIPRCLRQTASHNINLGEWRENMRAPCQISAVSALRDFINIRESIAFISSIKECDRGFPFFYLANLPAHKVRDTKPHLPHPCPTNANL